jgi:ABC-2 type transport system ATP-binding protein
MPDGLDRHRATIMAQGLGVRRGGRWLLRPATFNVDAGVIGVAGRSEAGKSTLLATLATLRRPAVGTLELFGHDVGAPAGQRAVRSRLGLLPGGFSWANGLSVEDFVAYAAYFKRTPKDAIGAVLERFELTDSAMFELGMLPADLRLRAGLAATCVHEPELVLLDEPLAEVDDSERAELIKLMRGLATTVVVTAPDNDALSGWCDRVFTLARGRLVESVNIPRQRSLGRSSHGGVAGGLRV